MSLIFFGGGMNVEREGMLVNYLNIVKNLNCVKGTKVGTGKC